MRLFLLSLLFISFVLINAFVNSHSCFSNDFDMDLKYIANENIPFVYEDQNSLKGISVDILRLLWKDLGIPEQEISLYPWARAYRNLGSVENTVLLGIAKSPDRESYCKWAGPFAVLRFGVFALKERNIIIRSFEDLNSYRIGTINKDIVEVLLKQKGFSGIRESVNSNFQNIEKLKSERIDLIGSFEISFYEAARKAGYNPEDFELVYILEENGAFYGFHNSIPDSVISGFQNSLDSHKDIIKKIIDSYIK